MYYQVAPEVFEKLPAACFGAVAGIVVGAAVDGLWLAFLSGTGIYEIIPAFAASMIAAIVASLLSKKPDEAVEALFDKAVNYEE